MVCIFVLGAENMKIKNSFPLEMLLIDFVAGLFAIGLSVYFLICKEYVLSLLLLGITIVGLGLLTFFAFLFSRLYIIINKEYVEIRKYFKIRKYELHKCSFIVDEINETIQGDLIYILTIIYENTTILRINSNSLDPEFRTRGVVLRLQEYNKR